MSKENNKQIMKVLRVTEGAFYVRIELFAAGGDLFIIPWIIPSFFFLFLSYIGKKKKLGKNSIHAGIFIKVK